MTTNIGTLTGYMEYTDVDGFEVLPLYQQSVEPSFSLCGIKFLANFWRKSVVNAASKFSGVVTFSSRAAVILAAGEFVAV